jgi:hypothetical protein
VWAHCFFGCHAATATGQVLLNELSSLHFVVSKFQQETPNLTHTEVNVAPSAGVEPQGSIACWTLLGLEFANVLVEASFVGHMPTRQLQDAFASQRVLQRLFTYSTIAAYEGPLTSCARPFDVKHSRHTSGTVQWCLAVDAGVIVSMRVGGKGFRSGGGRGIVGAARARTQSS